MTKVRHPDPSHFINRELSWLAFNERVLEEATDPTHPLLERVKFGAIVASNLDEFFMVRVAGLKHELASGKSGSDPAGLSTAEQLAAIAERAHAMVARLYDCMSNDVLPELARHGIRVVPASTLTDQQRAAVSAMFRDEVLPALTPLAIDVSRPFPMVSSLSLNVAVWLAPAPEKVGRRLAIVQVPAMLSRLVRVAVPEGITFVCLEDVIRTYLPQLFPGQEILESTVIRLSRDAEMELDDEGGRPFLEVVEEELRRRRRGDVIRFEVDAAVSEDLLSVLVEQIRVAPADIYRIPGLLDLRSLMSLLDVPHFDELRDRPWRPVDVLDENEQANFFTVLDQRDVLLHHPYDCFDPVVAFVVRAAEDPDVLAIKQTLYRSSGDSPIIEALIDAADRGKQVTVLVELLARFDEERNLRWVRKLEEAGAHVIYGIQGFKVHAKICLVVRRTAEGIRRYVHLGTGNYNDRTARIYTDFGLLTSDSAFAADASAFFSALTGYSDPPRMTKLVMAPTGLRGQTLKLIDRERRRALAGQPARIRAKLNSLTDPDIIEALYAASQAGVEIQLNVRGICSLRPGVMGLSGRIEVVSIVDRFLEHARIYAFRKAGDEEVFLSSADWMTRNLDKRIELMFPVEEPACRAKVLEALDTMFLDTVKARRLTSDGTYTRRHREPGAPAIRAQHFLYQRAPRQVTEDATPAAFTPRTNPDPKVPSPAR